MDAFERLVAELMFAEGYWVQTCYKVKLPKEEKKLIGRPSTPRWELDVVGYRPSSNQVMVLECKSFLDSRGVTHAEFDEGHASTRYKLFKEPLLRETVLNRLLAQMAEKGLCRSDAQVQLGMAAAKFKSGDEGQLRSLFEQRGWVLYGPDWLRERLHKLADEGYSNQVSSVVAKLLLRDAQIQRSSQPREPRLGGTRPVSSNACITVLVESNPKRPGTKAFECFQGYYSPEATTVQGALACGVRWKDIRHDLKKGFIHVAAAEDEPSTQLPPG